MFNTTAEFTKERRRSGFEEYFELLLRLGPDYAPFVATFFKNNATDEFDEIGLDGSLDGLDGTGSPTTTSPTTTTTKKNGNDEPEGRSSSSRSPRGGASDGLGAVLGDGDDIDHTSRNGTVTADESDDSVQLARPASALQWLTHLYFPVFGIAWLYARLLTLVHAIRPTDWTNGAAWLAIATTPLVLTVAFALLAPLCDGDLENISS